MKARTYQFMMTALLFLQVTKVTYGQSILSENDSLVINKYHVNPTQQQSPNWCVFACMEAIKASSQCSECNNYIEKFLLEDYHNGTNPYPSSFMSDNDFKEAMFQYDTFNVGPCDKMSTFMEFGVNSGDLTEYIGYEVTYSSLCNLFRTPHDGYCILAVSSNDNNAHCVVVESSETYFSVNDPRSNVTIMDPYDSSSKNMPFSEFQKEYLYYYSNSPVNF